MLIALLDDVLGSHTEKSKGNLAYHCPFCKHRKQKLEIQPELGVWACWVCNSKGKTLLSLFRKIGVTDGIMQRFYTINPKFKKLKPDNKNNEFVQLPREFKPLYEPSKSLFYRKAYSYALNERGFTDDDLFKYNIGYCEDGRWKNMLVFPNYNSGGQLNFISTRSFINSETNKFVNVSTNRNIVGFELQINPELPLIITEGAIDAITVRLNGTPLYGKTMSQSLKIYILENDISDIYICLDPDAINKAIEYISWLINFGINVHHIVFPNNTDVNKLGYSETWNLIKKSLPLKANDVFEMKIKNKLL